MLTKEYIKEQKLKGKAAIANLIDKQKNNNGNLIFILENLGHLPDSFDADFLLSLLNSQNEQVRFWAVKNLGKLNNESYLSELKNIVQTDKSTNVKREAVSSIGRMRNGKSQDILLDILKNEDPKIVCQAIRGLLVFKGDRNVDSKLRDLINHENETIRTVIYKEYFAKAKTDKHILPHAETYDFLKNTVVNADVSEALKYVPDESVHLTFTSPPYYNARDYSIYPSYRAYLEFLEKVFVETLRITKEGRFLIINTSPIIIPRVSRSHSSKRYAIPFDLHPYLVKNGWEFIDDIVWLKPEASVKNRIGGFMQHRKPLGYKPNSVTEYLMVYRKQTEKLIDRNIKHYDPGIVENSKVSDGFETTNVWQISPKSDKVHSAVFPVELCKRVVEYYSYEGDLVFDPFGGSGTFGRTAKSLGRYFFMTERDQKYFDYMKSLFNEDPLFEERKTSFYTLEQFKNIVP